VYCVPTALLTEAILHANNSRDIKADSAAGCTTLATLIGLKASRLFFFSLYLGAYSSILYIGVTRNWGCLASLFTLPLAKDVCDKFSPGKMRDLPEEVAKMHLPFGLLMFLGILFTSQGILQ
jgi:1,4-dihydroxy-2-naphthoate octaprenyltransferase